ncbi:MULTISPECIES: O-antigen translocase [Elizabethkingia]|uniref:O-antigen translocase n=1 Tax=Elizabethkingia TaxID=308865 RepID=UPI0005D911AF|nr:O-antigen translocase [Elizabethkingia ursingii]AJW64768.1 Polysaccharide biosynthesis protein [Elizabethkingia miricola]KUY27459.1 multidrug transporter MatE [Elizabethkingia ursingii]
MGLVKTSFFSGLITLIRIASGFVANKVVAIYTGPGGVAIIGAFTNFIALALTFANGAINNGVIKYTSEYGNNEYRQRLLVSTSFKISLYCSIIIGPILILFAPFFSQWILTNDIYTNAIRVLGCSIILYSLNSLLISILNGRNQIKLYTLVNTLGSVIGLVLTICLVYFFKVYGALYALVLSQSIVFFITLILIIKSPWFSWDYFKQPVNKIIVKKLGGFSLMAIVTAISVPVSQILLRNLLIEKVGIDGAGYWQGMMKVSDGYLLLIVTSLSTYYLPKLASLKKDKELQSEIFKGYKIILPCVFIGCVLIYYLRFFIIKLLYTSSFYEMESLFLWQLVGDFFKMAAWVLSYLMLAKAMIKVFIITEIVFTSLYVILGFIFVHYFKLWGITFAFALNYILYFLTMLFIFRKLMFNKFV